jgi:hypothetical protein
VRLPSAADLATFSALVLIGLASIVVLTAVTLELLVLAGLWPLDSSDS